MKNRKNFKVYSYEILVVIVIIFLISSCTASKIPSSHENDIQLNSKNYILLKGTYSNISNLHKSQTLYNKLQDDTISSLINYSIQINPIDKKRIEIKLMNNDTLISSTVLKGKFKKGLFKIKTKWEVKFLVGPIIWALRNKINYLGLTKENDLILLDSGGGIMLLVAFPIFGAGSPPYRDIFSRKN